MSVGVWFPTLGLLAWLCCLSLGPVQGGKVLVLPVDGSHWLSMKILVKELNQRGHEVLVLVPDSSLLIHSSESFKTEVYPVSFTKADLDGRFEQLTEGLFLKPPQMTDIFLNVQRLVSFTSLQSAEGRGFDLVLTDPFLPCGKPMPSPPSYVPAAFSGNTNIMTFPQRVKNMLMSGVESYMCRIIYSNFDDLVSRHLEEKMTYKELISYGAIWLLRYDFTFEWPKPIMPNMAFIGGINCAKKAPLPEIKEFVDGSGDDGFIVFTLGSMVSNMPEETAKQFFEAFRQLPQRVLWRYTGVPPKDAPKNVKLMKWLPQNDLLGMQSFIQTDVLGAYINHNIQTNSS
uniref:UDP glucuronosyltransferase 1 family, polypeptide A1 n=1 Tax=Labrus bergylta TaxID=56723 RepID=A0A3Q3G2C1_9LABR